MTAAEAYFRVREEWSPEQSAAAHDYYLRTERKMELPLPVGINRSIFASGGRFEAPLYAYVPIYGIREVGFLATRSVGIQVLKLSWGELEWINYNLSDVFVFNGHSF